MKQHRDTVSMTRAIRRLAKVEHRRLPLPQAVARNTVLNLIPPSPPLGFCACLQPGPAEVCQS